jgi:hypothetical protein
MVVLELFLSFGPTLVEIWGVKLKSKHHPHILLLLLSLGLSPCFLKLPEKFSFCSYPGHKFGFVLKLKNLFHFTQWIVCFKSCRTFCRSPLKCE